VVVDQAACLLALAEIVIRGAARVRGEVVALVESSVVIV